MATDYVDQLYPPNPTATQPVQCQANSDYRGQKATLVYHEVSAAGAAAASATAVHAAVTDNGSTQTITTSITNPPSPRNITATAGGTSADVKAIQVTVTGTDMDDQVITEDLPAFTVNTTGTVTGSKIFKTVTSVSIPAHDGTGATTSIGTGSKLGLPYKASRNTVLKAWLGDTVEGTAPTVTVSSSVLASNGYTLNSALNGTKVGLLLALPNA